MYCAQCGTKVVEGHRFCGQCGTRVGGSASSQTPEPIQKPVSSPERRGMSGCIQILIIIGLLAMGYLIREYAKDSQRSRQIRQMMDRINSPSPWETK